MKLGISYKTVSELRAFTAQDVKLHPKVYLTDEGKEGEFIYDSTDTTSADNIGTILVTTSGGYRYKRKYKSNVYASWFIDTSDSTGTSGNRERNAIHRAYTYVAAQTKPQTVVLDNSRIWYVNNNAIYLNIDTGKKITIKGEGNPVVDFLCSGGTDGVGVVSEAVFRTANSWVYPGGGGSQYTASVSGTTMTVTAVASGILKVGQLVYGGSFLPNTFIVGAITGTGNTGTYTLNKSQTLSSTTYYSKEGKLGWTNGVRTISYGKIEIKGITFDGNRNPANAGSSTVYSRPLFFRSCQQVNILDCTFQNIPGSGVAIGGTDSGLLKGNTFRSVFARETVNDAIGDGISIYAYCKNIRVIGNDISLSTGESGRCGISVDDYSENCVVSNNTVIGYERGIHIETSKGVNTIGNTVERSPIGILSGQNNGCVFSNNFIDGRSPVFGATLGGVGHLFVYFDNGGVYNNNTILGNRMYGELDFLAKFWGEKLIVKDNKFRWINDDTNQTLSVNTRTIANSGSITFNYLTAPNLVWTIGERIRASKDDFYYIEGTITAVNTTSVTITADSSSGSGIFSSWTLRYAPSTIGRVYGSGYNDDNEYIGNVFEYCNLEIDDTKRNIVKDNIFKSAYLLARNTTFSLIKQNEFIPFTDEIYSKGISVYGSVDAYISENYFKDPIEYVVDNNTATRLICEDNIYVKTNVNAAGNGYFFVNSSSVNTNVARTYKNNIIRDNINNEVYIIGNSGVAYLQTKVNVKDFNVKADGSTDDTTNLQTAFNTQKDVYVPKGTYLISGEIEIFGNVYCERGAEFRVATNYTGNLFRVRSKKNLTIENLYIDAQTNTGITSSTGLLIEGLWAGNINNFTMLSAVGNTTNIGIDIRSSETGNLGWGAYTITVNNPYIIRGNKGIVTNKTSSDTVEITHLLVEGGWIGSQETYPLHIRYCYNSIFNNIATDVIKLNTGVGYKVENSAQVTIKLGEYNIDPSTPDTAKIINIDDASCSFIDIQAERTINPVTITGTEYTLRTANAVRFKPTVIDGYYTEIRGDYNYGEPFVIEGNFGSTTLRKILSFDEVNGLRSEGVPLVTTSGVQALTNKSVNGVTLATGGSASLFLNQQGNYVAASGGGGGDALTTQPLSQFAATTSAQLAGVISDETGSGSLVFSNSPTLVTPNLGTPSAINLTNATSIPAGQLTGTISSGVLGNSTVNVGTTAIALNRASGALALTGITSIDGFAAAVTLTADNTTNATNYPLFANAATGNLSPRTDTGFTYNPSTGVLTSTTFAGALSGNATTATTLQTGRTINGTTFDGSANIIITAAAGTLTGTTLNATVTGSSLTSVGTITSGTWSGSFGAVSGANLTNLTAANLTGTIPSAVLGNSSHFIGTTSIALNRASANQALTGISSITLPGSVSGTVQLIPTSAVGTGTILTIPATTGTIITTGDSGTVTNTMLAGSIANAKLANSTISGVALGSNLATLTIGTGLTGTSYNGSGAVTIAIDSTVVTLSGSQTLTNKTLTSPTIATIINGAATLTLPTTTDTIVGRATTDTLSNKTLTAPRIADLGFIADANGNELIIFDTVASAVNEVTFANATSGNNPVFTASGGDPNIGINFVPKGSGTIQVSGLPVVTTTATQTLTNKTLTTPIISSISNTGTLTLPTSTDTLVGRATTDTLTNKRITARVQSTTSTATFTFNFDNDDAGIITAQAAGLTVTTSGTPTSMQPFVLCIKDNGTARAITWNAIFVAIGVTLPTTTVVNKHMYISGYYNTTAAKVHIVGVTTEA